MTVSAKQLPGAGGGWAPFGPGTNPNALIAVALRSLNATFTLNSVTGTFRVIADLGTTLGSAGETAIRVVVDTTVRFGLRSR